MSPLPQGLPSPPGGPHKQLPGHPWGSAPDFSHGQVRIGASASLPQRWGLQALGGPKSWCQPGCSQEEAEALCARQTRPLLSTWICGEGIRNYSRLLLFTSFFFLWPTGSKGQQLALLQLVKDALRGLSNQKTWLYVSRRAHKKSCSLSLKTSPSVGLPQRLLSSEEPVSGVFSITVLTAHAKPSPWTLANCPFDLWCSQKHQGFKALSRGGSGWAPCLLCCWKKNILSSSKSHIQSFIYF